MLPSFGRSHVMAGVLLTLLILFGCSPSMTELWLQADGGGKMEVTMDLAEMMDMIGPMIESMGGEEDASSQENDFFDSGEDMDSIASFYDIMPDSLKDGVQNVDLLKKMQLHLRVNKAEEVAFMKMIFNYDSPQELAAMTTALGEMKEMPDNPLLGAGDGDLEKFVLPYELDARKRTISIATSGLVEDMLNDPDYADLLPMLDSIQYLEEGSDERMLLEMIFGGTMTTKIHAPGKVKKVSDPAATVGGRTVTIETNMLEELQKKEDERFADLVIKYKKVK